jgi:aryl-alcohol dehydrogenase-like predicted oxidoreductase
MRKLGRTGLKVAALCLGGNTFGWTTDQTRSAVSSQRETVFPGVDVAPD